MKTLCISGALESQISHIAAHLQSAGMGIAKPAARSIPMHMSDWHDRVFSNQKSTTAFTKVVPGRLWEQLAGDIYLANIDQACWGWADKRSLELLDFWHEFESGTHFLLICASPEDMLAHAIETPGQHVDPAQILATWQTAHQEMLRFHLRHPERSLLIHAADYQDNPTALSSLLQTAWNLPFEAPAPQPDQSKAATTASPNPVARFIAQQLISQSHYDESLSHEINAACQTASTTPTASNSCSDIIEALRQLKRGTITAEEFAAQKALTEAAETRLKQREQELETQLQEQQSAYQEAQAESELLLMQLHQVQEELERLFLKNTEIEQNLKKINTERNEEAKAVATQRTALENQIQTLQAQQEQQQNTQKEAKEENELLILQLHLVQEELENYYLKFREGEQKLQQAEKRWQRMQQSNPNYHAYSALEVSPLQSTPTSKACIQWQFNELDAAGRSFDELKVTTSVEGEIANLEFKREQDGKTALTRWVPSMAGQDRLQLAPLGPPITQMQRARIIQELAYSDWQLVRKLPGLIQEALRQPETQALIPHPPTREQTHQGLTKLQGILEKLDAAQIPRFDTATLKSQESTPDYEHLWFQLCNLYVAGKLHPTFEFRLACANIPAGTFGQHPRLEFPIGSQNSFDNWFPESENNFGPKLEQRFALPDAMDLDVWQKLSANDKKLLLALLELMPQIIDAAQQNGANLQRTPQAWLAMNADMQRITQQIIQAQTQPARQASASRPTQTTATTPVARGSSTPQKTARTKTTAAR